MIIQFFIHPNARAIEFSSYKITKFSEVLRWNYFWTFSSVNLYQMVAERKMIYRVKISFGSVLTFSLNRVTKKEKNTKLNWNLIKLEFLYCFDQRKKGNLLSSVPILCFHWDLFYHIPDTINYHCNSTFLKLFIQIRFYASF